MGEGIAVDLRDSRNRMVSGIIWWLAHAGGPSAVDTQAEVAVAAVLAERAARAAEQAAKPPLPYDEEPF